MCVDVSVCGPVHTNEDDHGVQKRVLHSSGAGVADGWETTDVGAGD